MLMNANTPMTFAERMALWKQRNSKTARAATGFRNSVRNGIKPNASGMGQTGVNATKAVKAELLARTAWNYDEAKRLGRTIETRANIEEQVRKYREAQKRGTQGGGKRRQTAGGKGKRRQTRSRSRFW